MSPTVSARPQPWRPLLALFISSALVLAGLPASAQATGSPQTGLSSQDARSGLKEALTRGAEYAVAELGKPDGFLANPKVKIGLPESLHKVESMGRMLGLAKPLDQLVTTMNHAAESAVVEARPLLVAAVKNMSVTDAAQILNGPQDAATQYFRQHTASQLEEKFLPIVKQATARLQLAEQYDRIAGKAARYNLIEQQDAQLDHYVTRKAMDGLFLMIAEQERKIRANPLETGSKLLGKVFGSLLH